MVANQASILGAGPVRLHEGARYAHRVGRGRNDETLRLELAHDGRDVRVDLSTDVALVAHGFLACRWR